MQAVFLLSAAAMFVPVIFHTTRVSETDSLNKQAPGDNKKSKINNKNEDGACAYESRYSGLSILPILPVRSSTPSGFSRPVINEERKVMTGEGGMANHYYASWHVVIFCSVLPCT